MYILGAWIWIERLYIAGEEGECRVLDARYKYIGWRARLDTVGVYIEACITA